MHEYSEIITWAKLLWYSVFASLFMYLNIPQEQLWWLAMLMIIDIITGMWKQFTIDPRQISSRALSLWVTKKFTVVLLFLSLAIAIKVLWLDPWTYVTAIISVLTVSEVYSTIQNVYTIRTWKHLPEFDIISLFIKWLGKTIQDKLLDITKNNK